MVLWSLGCYLSGVWLADQEWLLAGVTGILVLPFLLREPFRKAQVLSISLALVLIGAGFYQMHQVRQSLIQVPAADPASFHAGIITDGPRLLSRDREEENLRYRLKLANSQQVVYVDMRQPVGTQPLWPGDKIAVSGLIEPLRFYHNNAGYAGPSLIEQQNLIGTIRTEYSGVRILEKQNRTLGNLVQTVRQFVGELIRQTMPSEQAAVLIGILLGGYEGIPPDWIKQFSATGLIHLLSVSGSHVSLIGGFTVLLCRKLRLSAKWIFAIALVVLLLYATIADWSAPVVRSVIMGSIALGALTLERSHSSRQALIWAVFLMLLQQPLWIHDLSFDLSVGATAGIILFYQPTLERLQQVLPRLLAQGLSLTWAAQIGVLPVMANEFHSLSLSSFLANLTVGPILEGLLLLTLVACLGGFFWAALGKILLIITSLVLQVALMVVGLLASIPGAFLPAFNQVVSLVYYALLLYSYGYFTNFLPLCGVSQHSIKVVFGLASIGVAAFWLGSGHDQFEVHFIDVGQGDAILVLTPHGRSVLIDAGPAYYSQGSSFDLGERIVSPYIKQQGVQHLNELILTHGHEDHAGGATAVARNFQIDRIWLSRGETGPIQALKAQASPLEWRYVREHTAFELDGVRIEILPVETQKEWSNVILIDYAGYRFLLTGDMEEAGEEAFLRYGLGQVDVLKVGHHGSSSSSSALFLRSLQPKYAIISVGTGNRYGHPHSTVLQRLKSFGAQIYRTDQHGAVVFGLNPQGLSLRTVQKLPPQ